MVDYNALLLTANRLIKANGRQLSLIKLNSTPANASQPWNGPAATTETSVTIYGCFVPPNTVRQFGLTALGKGTEYDDLFTFSEQIVIFTPGEIDVKDYAVLLDEGVRWSVIGSQVLRPGSVTLLGFLGVRR